MTRTPRAPSTGPDYGPTVTRTPDGKIRHLPSAAEVVIEDRPDPEQPDRGRTPITVCGARRYDAVLTIYGPKSSQFVAACRLRADCEAADGARESADNASVRAAFDAARYGPTDKQLDAIARKAAALQAMGKAVARVVSALILGCMSAKQFEAEERLRHGTGSLLLKEALDRLVTHYDRIDQGGNARPAWTAPKPRVKNI